MSASNRPTGGRALRLACAAAWLALMAGCATRPPPVDYGAFLQSRPATLLVLPPLNDSPDVRATPAVWSHATLPLAEAGYYVLPVTLVDETLRQNGIQTPGEAHEIATNKLREVFGADAAVYLRVLRYGSSYRVVDSETRVEVEGRIVDLRSQQLLWTGRAVATSTEQSQQTPGGLAGLLVAAVVKQIISSATDQSYTYAARAQSRLLGAPRYNGVLPGPRSPTPWQVPASP